MSRGISYCIGIMVGVILGMFICLGMYLDSGPLILFMILITIFGMVWGYWLINQGVKIENNIIEMRRNGQHRWLTRWKS